MNALLAAALQAYLSLGLAHQWGVVQEPPDKYYWHEGQSFQGPYGTAELGLRYRGLSVYGFHTSDISTSRDKGVNEVGVKYEFHLDLIK